MTRASEILTQNSHRLAHRVPPNLKDLGRAVAGVLDRWPNAIGIPDDVDRERLAIDFKRRIAEWDWLDVTIARSIQAAIATFDESRRSREDLKQLREFYYQEILASNEASFLSGLFSVYLESFSPDALHTRELSRALSSRVNDLGNRNLNLLRIFPQLLDAHNAASELAAFMASSTDPYQALRSAGFSSPHQPGIFNHAHISFINQISNRLDRPQQQEQLLRWLAPEKRQALQLGAGTAIEALLRPWRNRHPSEEIQSYLSEAILSAYSDPRTHHGGVWTNFDSDLKRVLLRWLTKEDMRFFCDMVTATQPNHMWPPRRDFWLQLFERGRIDEAWVAFGANAKDYAKNHLRRHGAQDVNKRFGTQYDRGGSTSLLIMRIGRKIVVDGCHSYKTHIFEGDDASAPQLYKYRYECDDIMRTSKRSKPHNSIPSWKDWVERNI